MKLRKPSVSSFSQKLPPISSVLDRHFGKYFERVAPNKTLSFIHSPTIKPPPILFSDTPSGFYSRTLRNGENDLSSTLVLCIVAVVIITIFYLINQYVHC